MPIPMMRNSTLSSKLQLSFLLIGLLSIGGTGWQAFRNARLTIERQTMEHLTSIRETKKHQIEAYFSQIRHQLLTFAEDRMIIDTTKQCIELRRQMPEVWRQTRRPLPNNVAPPDIPGIARYRELRTRIDPILQHYRQRFGYSDIFLADLDHREIVYSLDHSAEFAGLTLDQAADSSLVTAYQAARQSHQPDFIKLVDFSPYPGTNDAPAAFIAAPIFDGQQKIGVVIFQLAITPINEVMTSQGNWRAEGFGQTGETYIVGADGTLRTDSRFFIQEPQTYFHQLLQIGTAPALLEQIRARGTSILCQSVNTVTALAARQGQTRTQLVDDYRGVPVISSSTPLNIPDVHWIILAEIDRSEAFRPVFVLREQFILLGLVILGIAVFSGFLIARTIARPILRLTTAAERFGQGDLTQRAIIGSHDEIGHLATTFNVMAESIMQKTEQLTAEIQERKRAEADVNIAKERLRQLSAHLQSVREDERKSLAREIHDELGQALTTLKLHLILLKEELPDSTLASQNLFATISDIMAQTITAVKQMITRLRPRLLDDLGLTAAIEWQIEEFQQRSGIACQVMIEPAEIILDPDRSTAVFRILQEALTNIARHAQARQVTVRLSRCDTTLELLVHDDGCGINATELNDPTSFGLIGMRERAEYFGGELDIQSQPQEGTSIRLSLRLPPGEIP